MNFVASSCVKGDSILPSVLPGIWKQKALKIDRWKDGWTDRQMDG